ncbi:reticulon-like protein B13 [Rutidosis leptorrhynchoides]|uniref:reticulon-like protein B13 n=1 Tax=Rutidosis leptorrhynchoides TaxID=125765 RepID=UPI003A998404
MSETTDQHPPKVPTEYVRIEPPSWPIGLGTVEVKGSISGSVKACVRDVLASRTQEFDDPHAIDGSGKGNLVSLKIGFQHLCVITSRPRKLQTSCIRASCDGVLPHAMPIWTRRGVSSCGAEDDAYSWKDVIMWRKKRLSVGVLTTATVLWVVMEVYAFNFITVSSWLSIFLFSSLFAWANIYRLIYKEEPTMSGIGISENTANGIANLLREYSEEAARWMFKIGAQSEWYVFAATVIGLWLLSIVGSLTDLLTLLFIGTVVGMSVPVIWLKYDNKIREHGKRLQMHSKRFYSMMDEKVVQKIMNKVKVKTPRQEVKEKKIE